MLTRQTLLFLRATLILAAVISFQLSAAGQKRGEETVTTVEGQASMAWIGFGELLRFRAFNPTQTDSGKPNEAIDVQIKLYDERGALLHATTTVTIPPDEFRWIDIKREDLNVAGDPGTGTVQVRTKPLWGLRAHPVIHVATSLDLVEQATGKGTFRFYFTVETLP
jgi:hypothetical protein